MAPTCGSAQGTTEPTARNLDWTATPHCPESRSQPTIEYVATAGSVIGQGGEVELEQLGVPGRHEHAGDLGPGQGGLHVLRRAGADHDRPAGAMCLLQG